MLQHIHAGDLTEQITFQARAAGTDALGQASGAWANVAEDATVWAKRGLGSTRDLAAAGQMQAVVDAKFTVRWRADVQPTWRVLAEDGPYEILGQPIPLGGGREWLQILACKGVRDGM